MLMIEYVKSYFKYKDSIDYYTIYQAKVMRKLNR